MRFVITPALLAGSAGLLWVAAEQVAIGALVALVTADLAVSLAAAVATGRGWAPRHAQSIRIAVDVLAILGCMHLTGGLESRIMVLMFVPMAISAYELRRPGVLATAVGAGVLLTVYALFTMAGRIEPPAFALREGVVAQGGLIQIQVVVSLLLVVGYIAGELAGDFERRRRRIVAGEAEVDQLNRETRGILDNMGSGVLTMNRLGSIERMNPAAERILGFRAEDLLGNPVSEMLAPRMPIFVAQLMDCVEKGRVADRWELHVDRGDGQRVPLGVSVHPVEDHEGTRTGAVAVFQDLTTVVRLREKMRANDRLAAMGELSASIAHEIRNPLASIRGSVELLEGELQLDGENARLFELIRRESARLNRLVEDFLEYARLRPLQPRNVPLNKIIEDLARMVRSRDDLEEQARLETSLPEQEIIVHVDEELMLQVFLNIALNAYDATDKAGTLTISVALGTGPSAEAIVRFLDDGPGVAEDDLKQIFDPFFTTKRHGTGLGLPLANRVVLNHDGLLAVRNVDGAGAEFAIHLPLAGVMQDGQLKQGAEAINCLVTSTA
jgi:two-component system sensor histidine kinase PilS (NtrC family)